MDWFKVLPLAIGLSFSLGCSSFEGNSCKDTAEIFPMDRKSPGGTTGSDYVKSILGSHAVTLAPPKRVSEKNEKNGPKVSATPIPEGTRANLELSLPPGVEYTYLTSEYVPCKKFQNCNLAGVYCYNRFSIPIRAHLKSVDGSIDEVWQGSLTQADPADPRSKEIPHTGEALGPAAGQSFYIRLARPSASFQGKFKVSAPTLPKGMELTEHEVDLKVTLSGGKVTEGSIESSVRADSQTTTASFSAPVLSLIPAPPTPPVGTDKTS